MNKPVRIVLIVLAITALVIAGCVWRATREFSDAISTKVDTALYAGVVAQRQANGNKYYDFLPATIPADAEAVSFVHTPGFLQGGDSISLRVRLPLERIREQLQSLEQSGRQEVATFTPAPAPRCYPKFDLTFKEANDHPYESIDTLPPRFRIFLHRTDLEDVAKNWNHNFVALTAVSLESREIVFHVDNW